MFKYTKLLSLCIQTVKGKIFMTLFMMITKHILYFFLASPPIVHQDGDIIFRVDPSYVILEP